MLTPPMVYLWYVRPTARYVQSRTVAFGLPVGADWPASNLGRVLIVETPGPWTSFPSLAGMEPSVAWLTGRVSSAVGRKAVEGAEQNWMLLCRWKRCLIKAHWSFAIGVVITSAQQMVQTTSMMGAMSVNRTSQKHARPS